MSFQSKSALKKESKLESYFSKFKKEIVGIDQNFESPFGTQHIIYADWTASGRLYKPIEEKILHEIGPFVANTHTETSTTGSVMTRAYHQARQIIKSHVNASQDDVLITTGTGMTGAINKFQRILGIKLNENFKEDTKIPNEKIPVVFVTHMEHHSNQTTWLETIAKVVIIPPNEQGLPCLKSLNRLIEDYQNYKIKIAAITACSNVTGIQTNYYDIARVMHKHDGLCFVDFACSAPYVNINMHPEDQAAYLDAITFSPHKFLGGPGTSGVLIFNKKLYRNMVPDNPGGGTVNYTNPWGDHNYFENIEAREDGGTPGFLQTIRIALSINLKEKMGVDNILQREHELNAIVFDNLSKIDNLIILAPENKDRLGIFSFYIEGVHFNLVVKLLNDLYGIQTRGGCSCAGTYGHYLLNVDMNTSKNIEQKILEGCLFERPGWIRVSLHPTMTNTETEFICNAIRYVAENYEKYSKYYKYDSNTNEYTYSGIIDSQEQIVANWFSFK